MKCRFSGDQIPVIHSFGMQPLANGFLKERNVKNEYFFEMSVAVNLNNGLFQLVNQPEPSQMFHENYAFFSRTSNFMKIHFETVAKEILEILSNDNVDKENAFIVEVGSNDGVMLEHLVKNHVSCLGIEPSLNVAKESNKYGIETISEFISTGLAERIVQSKTNANVVYAANVFCHIPDIDDLAKACSSLLKDDGYLIFEDPYLGDVLEKVSYDQIYDEHVYLFNCNAVQDVFKKYGLTLFDCKPLITHGGSMRYYFKKSNSVSPSSALSAQLLKEDEIGIRDIESYKKFSARCEMSKVAFKQYLEKCKADGEKVIGYGATSKSTTILNYCNVGSELIDFIVDTTPIKQNTFTPGKHIPVLPYEKFSPHPDTSVLFAWNHKEEIMKKEKAFSGKWITHLFQDFF
jgi:methylation protein EvaC